MTRRKTRKPNNFIKYLKTSIRALSQARDLCLQSMASPMTFGNAMGCPTPNIPRFTRSFGTNSYRSTGEECSRDLIRASSMHSLNGRIEVELFQSKSSPMGGSRLSPVVTRTKTVVIGKIDEEMPLDYERDDVGLLRPDVYVRSRAHGMWTKKEGVNTVITE